MSKVLAPEMLVGKSVTSATADTAFLLLEDAQIREFYRLVVDQNVMAQDSRLVNVTAPELDLANVDIADGQMTGGLGPIAEMDSADELTPTFGGVTLSPQAFEVKYPFETTRLPLWNIEGPGLERTMDELVGTYYFNQMEEVFIHGDTAGANPAGYSTGMMTTIDGWIPQAIANCHVFDHGGAYVKPYLFESMIDAMPEKWIGSETARAKLRFYVPGKIERQYRYWLRARSTGLGDMQLLEDGSITYAGIPLVSVPKMHTNDAGVLTQSATADGLASILLCEPSNKLVGFNPQMRVFKHPRTDGKVVYVNLWGEYDCGYLNEDAVVVGVNVVPTVNPTIPAAED